MNKLLNTIKLPISVTYDLYQLSVKFLNIFFVTNKHTVIQEYLKLHANYAKLPPQIAGMRFEQNVLTAIRSAIDDAIVLSELEIRSQYPSITTCDIVIEKNHRLTCIQIKREKKKNDPNKFKAFMFDCQRLAKERNKQLQMGIFLSKEGPTKNCIDVCSYENSRLGSNVFKFVHDIDDLKLIKLLMDNL
jgi:hypothetical protein